MALASVADVAIWSPHSLVANLVSRWRRATCIVTLPWLIMIFFSRSRIDQVYSTLSEWTSNPKIGPRVYLGPIKIVKSRPEDALVKLVKTVETVEAVEIVETTETVKPVETVE